MSDAAKEYLRKYGNAIVRSTLGTGLFPSVMAAQGMLESAYGNSSLASEYNNHFGIKGFSEWSGPVVWLVTRDIINGKELYREQPFRVYSSPYQSFRDRIKFLKENKRYEKAGVFSAATPYDQAQAIEDAGYAAPGYAAHLAVLIDQNDLARLDQKQKRREIARYVIIVVVILLIIIGVLMLLHANKSEKGK